MKRFLVLLLLVACTAEKPVTPIPEKPKPAPPSAAEAKQIIESSGDFSEFEFTSSAYTLPTKRSAMLNDQTRAVARDLQKAGWISFSGDEVVLTSKALTSRRFLTRPNGYVDIVPLAKKEMGEVTAVRPTEEGVDVDFNWKWTPNDIGSAFKSGPLFDRYAAPQKATATLYHDGTSWRILRIRVTK